MKSKLFGLLLVMSLLVSPLSAGFALAQTPFPPRTPAPVHPQRAPAGDPELAPRRLSRSAAPAANLGALAIPLGSPGLSFRYLKTFGKTSVAYLADSAHLNYPWGISTTGNNLWVGELWGHSALKYSSTGAFLQRIGTPGDPDLADTSIFEITDVASDALGNVWVADESNAHVAKFSGSGHFLKELGTPGEQGVDSSHFALPVSVAFDGGGNIYVSDGTPWYDNVGDTGNQRIQVFTNSGSYLATIGVTGVSGTDSAHFHGPKHITVYGSLLYVADAGNQRVQIFNITNPAASTYVATLGQTGVSGSNNSHFNNPSGVAVDTDYIYVADTFNTRVQVFNRATRAYVKTIGGTWGTANNQFKIPTDVAVDAGHRLYVADFVNLRVQQFTHSGATFTYARTYGVTGVPYLTDTSHYNLPVGLAVAGDGSIYITEDLGHRLIKLNASGVPQWTVGRAGVKGALFTDRTNALLSNPGDVAVDATHVYVADRWDWRVQIYAPSNGALIGSIDGNCPSGVHVAPNGYLYVSDACDETVRIYDTGLNLLATLGEAGVAGSDNAHFNGPEDAAVDSLGTIYVSDRGNHRVQVFNSSRVYVRTMGTAGECGGDFAHLCGPNGLAVDSADRLYVGDAWNSRVQVFDSSGAYLTTISGAWGRSNSELRSAENVAVDTAGNVYVADWANDRIQKFARGYPGWTQSNINGFGDRWQAGTARLATFGGELYAGGGIDGAQVWRTPDGSAWSGMVTDAFGDSTNSGITDFVEFNGSLYASTWSCTNTNCSTTNGGQVWRSATGAIWSQVGSAGFGSTDSYAIGALAVFSNQIYAATSTVGGVMQIYRSSTGNPGDWSAAMSDGFGSNGAMSDAIMEVYGGYLYVGLQRNGVGELWRTSDGTTWSPVFTNGLAPNNAYVSSMAEFNGAFYVGLLNDTNGAELWKTTNGTTFTRAFAGGLGKASNAKPDGLYASNGSLYVVFNNFITGAEVWRSPDGITWTQVASGGWGDGNNGEADSGDNSAADFAGRLYIGTFNFGNGGEIWSTVIPTTASYQSAGAQDGWILESGELTNIGGTMNATATTFNLGDDALNKQYRAILSFDTTAVPTTAVIQSAILKIKQSGAPVGVNPFSVLGGLLVDIRKPYFGTSSALQLTDFNAAASALKVGTFGKTPVGGWYSVKLSPAGMANVNKGGLTQFRLYFTLDDNNNHLANYMKFFSGNAPAASQPILYIIYTVP